MKLAVVLIDMQARFLRHIAKKDAKRILKASIMVIKELCVGGEIPLVVVEYAGYGDTVRTLEKKIERVPECRRKLFLKSGWDGFECSEFSRHLHYMGVDTLLLTGIYADCCVKATAESAVANGYEIVTAYSLVAGTDFDYGGSARWYKKNGIFYESEISLLEDLGKGKLKNKNGWFKRFF